MARPTKWPCTTVDSDSENARPLTFDEKFEMDKNSNEEVLGMSIHMLCAQIF